MNAIGTLSETETQDPDGRPCRIFTMACDSKWRPTYRENQFEENQGDFVVKLSRFTVTSSLGTTFHGSWYYLDDAARFARSLDRGAVVNEVEPYWYAPTFGRVDAYR